MTHYSSILIRHQGKRIPLQERFWGKVDKRNGLDSCWLWTKTIMPNGYGVFRSWCKNSHKIFNDYAHRIAWVLTNGEIPKGLVIDHLCRNRACCNPAHMELVTSRENLLRGDTHQAHNIAKTACPLGHPYDPENTYIDKVGKRHCRICRSENMRRFRQRNPNYKKEYNQRKK